MNPLSSSGHTFINTLKSSISISGNATEATATIVWDYVNKCTVVPAMWNVFPSHPHDKDNPQSNRTPKKSEVDTGKQYVQLILDILSPTMVIAVGGTSAKTLRRLFPNLTFGTVRHPSRGGKADFLVGLEAAGIV